MDVKAFINSIIVKHFSKSMKNNRVLWAIQLSLTTDIDTIHFVAAKAIVMNLKANRNAAIQNLNDLIEASGFPLSILLKKDTHAWRNAVASGMYTLYVLQEASRWQQIRRAHLNLIIKQIPHCLAFLVRSNQFFDSPCNIFVAVDGSLVNARVIRNKVFQGEIKKLKVAELPQPLVIYRQEHSGSRMVQKYMKTQVLQAQRIKVLHKNVYSNERRFRFGLSDSPSCNICSENEIVEHQLFFCQNARRLWFFYTQIFGDTLDDFFDVIRCSSSVEK